MDCSVNYHRYSGFFHFKDMESVPFLVEWLKTRFEEVCAALEHMDHENLTDRHIQWGCRTTKPWTKADDNVFAKRGKMSKYLVDAKIPNAGNKHSRRHSKKDCVVAGYSWDSTLLYTAKEQLDTCSIWWYKDGEMQPCDDIIGKFVYPSVQAKERSGEKPRTFFDMCCEVYEENGLPTEKREIVYMLIERHVFGKWQNMDIRALSKMADTLLMKYHGKVHIHHMMARYDELFSEGKL